MEIVEAARLLMSPAGRSDPYAVYTALRRHGPLVEVRAGVDAAAMASSPRRSRPAIRRGCAEQVTAMRRQQAGTTQEQQSDI
ncbi:hypothetical protein OHA21_18825 [Actinoplanes sp. NBC_00393]|uniref:hypothetical protein n=1 Tax=Actinoplanes sp. NBC_00393 TaxID=2975953 RepID=UPI002E1CC4F5